MSSNNGKQVDPIVDEASLLRAGDERRSEAASSTAKRRSKDASSTAERRSKGASFTAESKDASFTPEGHQVIRDGEGRFVIGNPGGPGNPFARRVGELRRAMLAAVKEEDVADIIKALVARAKEGHVPAAKLVLSYLLGKPQPVADPDRADVDEWELNEATAAMNQRMAEVVKAPPSSVPLRTARVLRPLVGSMLQQKMADRLAHPEKHLPQRVELEVAEDKDRPSANGDLHSVLAKKAEQPLEIIEELKRLQAGMPPTPNGIFSKAKSVVKGGPSANGFLPKTGEVRAATVRKRRS